MPRFAAALALLAVAGLAGCGGSVHVSIGKGTQVKLTVIKHGAETIALVPVRIDGKGPFPFALDTGAATSAIDTGLARKLGLARVGRTTVSGVTKTSRVPQYTLRHWSAGSVQLGARRVAGADLIRQRGPGIAGLLGSDVLSRYHSVTIDYDAGVLVLR